MGRRPHRLLSAGSWWQIFDVSPLPLVLTYGTAAELTARLASCRTASVNEKAQQAVTIEQ